VLKTLLVLWLTAPAAGTDFLAPDCALVPGWVQEGEARSYDAETLFEYVNGKAESYFAYGFMLMKGITCVNPAGDRLVLDVSELGDSDRAWGFFVANRDPRSPSEALGSGGQVFELNAAAAKGRYYLEISASPGKDHAAALRAFVLAMLPRMPGEGRVPEAVAWFPVEGLEPGSLRLVPQSPLGLRLLKPGFIAQYADGRAFVAPEASAEAAQATLVKLRARFADARVVAGLGDEAIAAQDAYLGALVLFRKGAHVAGIANVPAGRVALPLAKALAARLP
jgi:hypothetical protein